MLEVSTVNEGFWVKNIVESPSLCPYLESGEARFYLAFSPVFRDNVIEGKAPFPFISMDSSGPLSRIVMADILSDAGAKISSVFVLLQQDVYRIPKDPMRPFSNKDVETCWQKTFSLCSGRNSDDSPMVLSVQTGKGGQLTPFESLFYCKKTKVFFPPPCPACGNTLHQCYDDDLLIDHGLQPYSTSLKRYLFCPTCFDPAGQSDFYVYELDGSDSPKLKDRWDLIGEFGRLLDGNVQAHRFPCLRCSENKACYGTDGQAAARMTPFCFYPFFMLIYPAMSIQAQDFLALLSGRKAEALRKQLEATEQIGRARCVEKIEKKNEIGTGFLFHGDKRHFLEVLYLKLCFVDMLFRTLDLRQDSLSFHDMAPSLEGVWVKVNNQGALLPFLWAFHAGTIGPRGSTEGRGMPAISLSQALYSMGMFWLYALLVNKVQGVAAVFDAMNTVIEKAVDLDEAGQKELLKNGFAHTTSPENIFWDPLKYPQKILEPEWLTLWNKAIELGWSLLMAGIKGHSGFSKEMFCQDCETLREQIKKHLFARQPSPAAVEAGGVDTTPDIEAQKQFSADKTISNMLGNIVDTWREELETAHGKDSGAGTKEIDGDLEETVMLAPGQTEAGEQAAVAGEDEDETYETVILSSGDFVEGPAAHVPTEQTDLEETVIISTSTGPAETIEPEKTAPQESSSGATPEEEMLDTVVISPSQARDAASRFGKPEAGPPEAVTQEDEAPETVIISPVQGRVGASGSDADKRGAGFGSDERSEDVGSEGATARAQDEDFTETVVINTKKPVDEK